jgi:5-methylcytosine-specific restriction enzyme B
MATGSVAASLNLAGLEKMKESFRKHCPGFVDFEQQTGTYFEQERAYKNTFIQSAQEILKSGEVTEGSIGDRFLDLLQETNFVGWRAFAEISAGGPQARATTSSALGSMVLSHDPAPSAIEAAAKLIHPVISKGMLGNPAFGQVRSMVSSALALAKPSEAISVKTRYMQRAAKNLTGKRIFKTALVDAAEYEKFLDLAFRVKDALTEWGWKPQDLWDVQGFLWVVTNYEDNTQNAEDTETEELDEGSVATLKKMPLNLILYGPPGTGKTWKTAELAVKVCQGKAPENRDELMKVYSKLVESKRIAFTTFHQSLGYEEFVEGLRPVTDVEAGENGATSALSHAGFRLEPRKGIFREICALAEQERKSVPKAKELDLSGRQFFKMSLGRADTEKHIYDAAIEGNYIVLGWGGDVDWSDQSYADLQKVADRWRQIEPNAGTNSGNISQVWRFRSAMKKGDIVIISEGNSRFRAIAQIEGDYQFHPQEGGWNHRRAVKWLRVLEESLPISLVYDGQLSQVSCYQMVQQKIKLEPLSGFIGAESNAGTIDPRPYVLIIDEINRANISKVLGELITMLEDDKRLGEPNAITVQLPYSNDLFGVPNNLYLIGTMNTADRSIALLDTALRRRFRFVEMMPDYSCLEDRKIEGVDLEKLLYGINQRLEWLFDRDHQIGQSYFINTRDKNTLDEVMTKEIIPLLAEYFYDDWKKVQFALNDSGNWFVKTEVLKPPAMCMDEEPRTRYSVSTEPIPIEAYLLASEIA